MLDTLFSDFFQTLIKICFGQTKFKQTEFYCIIHIPNIHISRFPIYFNVYTANYYTHKEKKCCRNTAIASSIFRSWKYERARNVWTKGRNVYWIFNRGGKYFSGNKRQADSLCIIDEKLQKRGHWIQLTLFKALKTSYRSEECFTGVRFREYDIWLFHIWSRAIIDAKYVMMPTNCYWYFYSPFKTLLRRIDTIIHVPNSRKHHSTKRLTFRCSPVSISFETNL